MHRIHVNTRVFKIWTSLQRERERERERDEPDLTGTWILLLNKPRLRLYIHASLSRTLSISDLPCRSFPFSHMTIPFGRMKWRQIPSTIPQAFQISIPSSCAQDGVFIIPWGFLHHEGVFILGPTGPILTGECRHVQCVVLRWKFSFGYIGPKKHSY